MAVLNGELKTSRHTVNLDDNDGNQMMWTLH
jgi:hypothetical protein